MRLPDGTILMHDRTPYDPVKAHDYYMRTRKLKGRRPARSKPTQPFVKNPFLRGPKSTYTVTMPSGKTVKLTQEQLDEQKAFAAKRVNDIKKNLAKLSGALKQRMVEARAAQAKAKRGPSAADKSKAARKAKQYRAKNQQQLANKRKAASPRTSSSSRKPKADPVAELEAKITQVKGSLAAAVAHQRSLMTATKNG